jgi:hypothetical protein
MPALLHRYADMLVAFGLRVFRNLISGHAGIYSHAPEVDSASHALAVLHSLPPKPVGYLQAAHAVVAEYDDPLRRVVQFIQALRNGLHGNQRGAFDVANGVLCRFPDIDQANRRSTFQEIADFGRSDLNWQFIHRPRV